MMEKLVRRGDGTDAKTIKKKKPLRGALSHKQRECRKRKRKGFTEKK